MEECSTGGFVLAFPFWRPGKRFTQSRVLRARAAAVRFKLGIGGVLSQVLVWFLHDRVLA